ncbi:MAG: helix-turn-helix transcriptional regulator [Clostridiales bacterium]|nr:helix-turn-helix transcriptional regulator [Clostridiales bacterium]
MNKFAERLKELRMEKNLSQNELSKLIGISVACINRWENNLRIPNIDSIITLCKFFGCTADYLIGLEY